MDKNALLMFSDISGTAIFAVFAFLMMRNLSRLNKDNSYEIISAYLYMLAISLFLFGISRSIGHILKHILLFANKGELWHRVSPFSGAFNSITMVFMASVTLFFRRALKIFSKMKREQRKLSDTSMELLRLNEQMNQLAGERTRAEIILDLAHEIRNPITVIGGLVRRLSTGKSGTNSSINSTYIPSLLEQAARLEDIVKRFEELISRQTHTFKVLDLNSIVRDCFNFKKETAQKKGIAIRLNLCKSPLLFQGHKEILELSIRHLIQNAIEACSPDDAIDIMTKTWGEGVAIEISDTGPGISKETIDNIFRNNRETDKYGRKRPVSFGLPFIKQVIEKHNGTISIDSGPNFGTTVRIQFPTHFKKNGFHAAKK